MAILRLRRPKPAEPETNPAVMEPLDSLFEILNRDQRTILTVDRKKRHTSETSLPGCNFLTDLKLNQSSDVFVPKKISSTGGYKIKGRSRSRGPRRRLAYISQLMCRLGEVFIVGVCLLTLVRVPAVMSAPSTRHAKTTEQIHSHRPTEDTLSYLNPCGKSHEEEINHTYYKQMASKESDPDILKHIIIRTKNALAYAESFRDRYVDKTFHVHFDNHHAQWENQRYDWLPNEGNAIPKRLGQNTPIVHLRSNSFDEFLVNIYEYLQKFAVGLEQIVIDQKRTQGQFRENFRMLEVHLRNVLCEIREAMIERNIAPRQQVPRSIMTDDIRNVKQESYRNVRDWFIFRDLMNGLEYVIQVFTFIEENLPQSSGPGSS